MNDLTIFENAQFGQIRTSVTESGEPLFCLADVCSALGLDQPSRVKSRLTPKGVQLIDFHALNSNTGVIINELGNRQANFIDEPNLYKCIFMSRKKEAEQFQDWVCGEVLPAIRKSGGYVVRAEVEKWKKMQESIFQDKLDIMQAKVDIAEMKVKSAEAERSYFEACFYQVAGMAKSAQELRDLYLSQRKQLTDEVKQMQKEIAKLRRTVSRQQQKLEATKKGGAA